MKRTKQQRWKASKEAAQSYEKVLSKYLKEKKASAKSLAAAAKTPAPAKAAATPAKAAKWNQWDIHLSLAWELKVLIWIVYFWSNGLIIVN